MTKPTMEHDARSVNAGINRRGDQVRVMTGRDRGKTGRVLAVNPASAR